MPQTTISHVPHSRKKPATRKRSAVHSLTGISHTLPTTSLQTEQERKGKVKSWNRGCQSINPHYIQEKPIQKLRSRVLPGPTNSPAFCSGLRCKRERKMMRFRTSDDFFDLVFPTACVSFLLCQRRRKKKRKGKKT